jgi:hypothetical protein
MEQIFRDFLTAFARNQSLLAELALKLQRLEIGQGGGGGGGGNATISDYESGVVYNHNALLNDTNNNNLYLVVSPTSYTSIDVDTDVRQGNLKLINGIPFENLVVIDHDPTREEVQNLDEGSVVVVFSPSDTPYVFPE